MKKTDNKRITDKKISPKETDKNHTVDPRGQTKEQATGKNSYLEYDDETGLQSNPYDDKYKDKEEKNQ